MLNYRMVIYYNHKILCLWKKTILVVFQRCSNPAVYLPPHAMGSMDNLWGYEGNLPASTVLRAAAVEGSKLRGVARKGWTNGYGNSAKNWGWVLRAFGFVSLFCDDFIMWFNWKDTANTFAWPFLNRWSPWPSCLEPKQNRGVHRTNNYHLGMVWIPSIYGNMWEGYFLALFIYVFLFRSWLAVFWPGVCVMLH